MYTFSRVETLIVAFSFEASQLQQIGLFDEIMPKRALFLCTRVAFLANETKIRWQSVPAGLLVRFMTGIVLENGTDY